MTSAKIVNFDDERYDRVTDYAPFGCMACSLTPEQKVDICMSGCYDNIIEEATIRKNEIEIGNVLIAERKFQLRVKEILEMLNKYST